MESWQKGGIACIKVRLRALDKGADIYVPTTEHSRYDMVVDWCGKLYRAQIKYAGGVSQKCQGVAVVSLTKGDHGERKYTSDEIDALLVYLPAVDKICWFGPEVFHGKSQMYIRYEASRNNQRKGCIHVEDYVW